MRDVYKEYKKLFFGEARQHDLNQLLGAARSLSDREIVLAMERITNLSVSPSIRYVLAALLVTSKKDIVLTSTRKIAKLVGKGERTIKRLFAEKVDLVRIVPTAVGTVVDFRGLLDGPAPCQDGTSWCQNDTTCCQNGTTHSSIPQDENDTTLGQNGTRWCQNDTTLGRNDTAGGRARLGSRDTTWRQNDTSWRQNGTSWCQDGTTWCQNDTSFINKKEVVVEEEKNTTTTTTTTLKEASAAKRSGVPPLTPLLRARLANSAIPNYVAALELSGIDVEAISPEAHKKLLLFSVEDFTTFVRKIHYVKKNAKVNPSSYILKVLEERTEELMSVEDLKEAERVAGFAPILASLLFFPVEDWIILHAEAVKAHFASKDPAVLREKAAKFKKKLSSSYEKVKAICLEKAWG
ncbi:MAG: hypothetical protein QW650_00050 [Thermofilum sp.]